jgi:hypothetical protein
MQSQFSRFAQATGTTKPERELRRSNSARNSGTAVTATGTTKPERELRLLEQAGLPQIAEATGTTKPERELRPVQFAVISPSLRSDRHHQTRKGIATARLRGSVRRSAKATGTTKPERELRPFSFRVAIFSFRGATGTTKPERELRLHRLVGGDHPNSPRPAPPNPKGNCDSLLRLSCFPFRSGRPAPPNPKGNCD